MSKQSFIIACDLCGHTYDGESNVICPECYHDNEDIIDDLEDDYDVYHWMYSDEY